MIKLTDEQVLALHSKLGVRQESYYITVLDKNNINKDVYVGLEEGSISVNADYDVKKSATITVDNLDDIDTMRDKIQIFMVVNQFEWSLGIFMITKVNGNTLSLDDETVKLQQSKPIYKKVFNKGMLYTDALKWFIVEGANSIKYDIQPSTDILPADIIIDDSKNLLQWFNYVADQINYLHLYVDNNGYFKSSKYQEPSFKNVGYSYLSNKYSVLSADTDEEIDYWNVPNVFKRIVSRGDIPPLESIYINDDPSNMFSTVSRGFKIVDTDTVDLVSTQTELDLLVSRLALKAQQVEKVVKIETANMPQHEIYDIIELEDGVYEEQSYSIDLNASSGMIHYLRRIVYGFEGIR